jgi:hypothetical protein
MFSNLKEGTQPMHIYSTDYIKSQQKLFRECKYTRWYFSIIESRISRILKDGTYTEKHHIIPKSIGGSNLEENFVRLTFKEHFIAHWLLTKMCVKKSHTRKMQYAMRSMSWNKNGNRIITSWQFEVAKKNVSNSSRGKILSESTRKKISDAGKNRFASKENRTAMSISKLNSPHSKHTKKTKKIISDAATERYKLEENRRITSETTKKAQSSEEFRKKRSELTKKRYQERPELRELCSKHAKGIPKDKVTCPYCHKIGGGGTMIRWHFDNCKFKN